MIRAALKKGKIEPVEKLSSAWRELQQLIVEGGEPADIKGNAGRRSRFPQGVAAITRPATPFHDIAGTRIGRAAAAANLNRDRRDNRLR